MEWASRGANLIPGGGSNPLAAMEDAFSLRPDVIFLLSEGLDGIRGSNLDVDATSNVFSSVVQDYCHVEIHETLHLVPMTHLLRYIGHQKALNQSVSAALWLYVQGFHDSAASCVTVDAKVDESVDEIYTVIPSK